MGNQYAGIRSFAYQPLPICVCARFGKKKNKQIIAMAHLVIVKVWKNLMEVSSSDEMVWRLLPQPTVSISIRMMIRVIDTAANTRESTQMSLYTALVSCLDLKIL